MTAEDIAKHPKGSVVTIKGRLVSMDHLGRGVCVQLAAGGSYLSLECEQIDSVEHAPPPDYTPTVGERVVVKAITMRNCVSDGPGTVVAVSSDAKECGVLWDCPSRLSIFVPDEWGNWNLMAAVG